MPEKLNQQKECSRLFVDTLNMQLIKATSGIMFMID
jgi:hypothetical protein